MVELAAACCPLLDRDRQDTTWALVRAAAPVPDAVSGRDAVSDRGGSLRYKVVNSSPGSEHIAPCAIPSRGERPALVRRVVQVEPSSR
jgi:hypothetical protein